MFVSPVHTFRWSGTAATAAEVCACRANIHGKRVARGFVPDLYCCFELFALKMIKFIAHKLFLHYFIFRLGIKLACLIFLTRKCRRIQIRWDSIKRALGFLSNLYICGSLI